MVYSDMFTGRCSGIISRMPSKVVGSVILSTSMLRAVERRKNQVSTMLGSKVMLGGLFTFRFVLRLMLLFSFRFGMCTSTILAKGTKLLRRYSRKYFIRASIDVCNINLERPVRQTTKPEQHHPDRCSKIHSCQPSRFGRDGPGKWLLSRRCPGKTIVLEF